MHKKHVQEINNKNNNNIKSHDKRKCSPKINIDQTKLLKWMSYNQINITAYQMQLLKNSKGKDSLFLFKGGNLHSTEGSPLR